MERSEINNYHTICPLQYFGIGDVIFTQTLLHRLAGATPILWGVLPHFAEGLTRAYPRILWEDYRQLGIDYNNKRDIVINGRRMVPIRWADTILKVPYARCMASKYDLYKMDWSVWKEQAMWQRDRLNEDILFDKVVLNDAPYNLVNSIFGSDNQLKVSIKTTNGLQNVEMKTISGFSLFDWAKVIENATEIHTVSTSIVYLLELLNVKGAIHLYPRIPIEPDFRNVDYILNAHQYQMHL